MANNNTDDKKKTMALVFSYLTLRRTMGVLGVLFPFFLVVGAGFYNGFSFKIECSISYFYYTSAKHIFGGILFVVAFFLFAYKGYESNKDSYSHCVPFLKWINLQDGVVGNMASFFAIGVVLFPTTAMDQTQSYIGILHYIFAGGLFLCLIYFSLCLFTRSKLKVIPIGSSKRKRNMVYNVCGFVMITCILLIPAIAIYLNVTGNPDTGHDGRTYTFWLESFAFWAFGISWAVKGRTIWKDQEAENK